MECDMFLHVLAIIKINVFYDCISRPQLNFLPAAKYVDSVIIETIIFFTFTDIL
jgi:hypothetical protein